MKKKLIFIAIIFTCFVITGCNKEMNTLENVSIKIKDDTLTKTSATIIITDKSNKDYNYDEWFRIDKKENNKWKELETISSNWIDLPVYKIENNTLEMNQDWTNIYGSLKKGNYRLVKEVNDKYISVEFTIK